MTADTVTFQRIDDLLALMSASYVSIARLQRQVSRDEIDPAEAAAIVNETIQNLTNEAR